MRVGLALGAGRSQSEVGQPLMFFTYIAQISILTLLHPARWSITVTLSLGLWLGFGLFGPGGAASVFEVGVVHFVLAFEALGDGQHVLVLSALYADIIQCVFQQSHLLSCCLVVLGSNILPWGLQAFLADVESFDEQDDAILKLLDMVLQSPVFFVRLSQQELELEHFIRLVLPLYLAALCCVFECAFVMLKR